MVREIESAVRRWRARIPRKKDREVRLGMTERDMVLENKKNISVLNDTFFDAGS